MKMVLEIRTCTLKRFAAYLMPPPFEMLFLFRHRTNIDLQSCGNVVIPIISHLHNDGSSFSLPIQVNQFIDHSNSTAALRTIKFASLLTLPHRDQ